MRGDVHTNEPDHDIGQDILYGIIIILLLICIGGTGGAKSDHRKAYQNYTTYIEEHDAPIDYSAMEDYFDTHAGIRPDDENTYEGTMDDDNNVFVNCSGIEDKGFIHGELDQAIENDSKTGWFCTVDCGNYRLTVMRKDENDAWGPVACFDCAVGGVKDKTERGMFTIDGRYTHIGGLTWATGFFDESHYIAGLWKGYPGEYANDGNVYLEDVNAKFVEQRVPDGTPILIHE